MKLLPALALPSLCALIAASGAYTLIRSASRYSLIDVPNDRSSHQRPTPRGGGAGIVVSMIIAVAVLGWAYGLPLRTAMAFATGLLVALSGLIDDRIGLSPLSRLAVQAGCALAALSLLGGLPAGDGWLVSGWVGFLLLGAVVGFTNFFNFMDGIDGIAACEAMFIAAAGCSMLVLKGEAGALALFWLCLAGASAGFLVFNWPPARIFMGDVGSAFLGFSIALAALATSLAAPVPLAVWPILGGAFIIDASLTLGRRMLRRERWYAPHRIHAYQHLSRRWHSHQAVTLAYGCLNLCWLLPWALVCLSHPDQALTVMAVALLPVAGLFLLAGAGRPESPVNRRGG